jgi:hypothetical protein
MHCKDYSLSLKIPSSKQMQLIRILRLSSILALGALVSCRQSQPFTDSEKNEVERNVRQTLDRYHDDVRNSGLTAEFRYLDSSSDFFWVPPGYAQAISYDSVKVILEHNAPRYRSVSNHFNTLRIIPLTKEVATYTGRLKSVMSDTSGKTSSFSLIESGVLIKREDGWKLLSGQTAVISE